MVAKVLRQVRSGVGTAFRLDLLQRTPVQNAFYQCISTFVFCFLCYILSFCASLASGGGRAERVKRQRSKCIDATSLLESGAIVWYCLARV